MTILPGSLRLGLLACVALGLGTTGCGTVAFKPSVQSVGEYKNTAKAADVAEQMPEHSAAGVKVLVETLPEGMVVRDGALDFDHDRYEMLGKVSATYKDPSGVNMGLWFYDYKESEKWRAGLCTWQVPLSWVTLTMWSWLSPTFYPCRVNAGEEEARRADIVETLQRATKSLGGDLVVVAGFGGINFLTVNGQTGTVVATNSVGTLNGLGYAFKTTGVKRNAKGSSATPVKGAVKL
jgi:hypothetical protein